MYFVNQEQIDRRLAFVPTLRQALLELAEASAVRPLTLLERLAQERAVHLAIETVTDVGSLMIDGFIMRDASSYEDIIDILQGEDVFVSTPAGLLSGLVKLRKPLVQDYMATEYRPLDELLGVLPEALESFGSDVRAYLAKHL